MKTFKKWGKNNIPEREKSTTKGVPAWNILAGRESYEQLYLV